jgi:predicted acyltransferase
MTTTRFVALDALRGLILALMILVNTPGSWSAVYSPLLHADWHGFTFADLVFPGFLFVVGAAMFFALKTQTWGAASVQKVLRRTLLMFVLGLGLNFLWTPDFSQMRLMGVLQRIAFCYGLAALLVLALKPLFTGAKQQYGMPLLSVLLLFLYWCLLQLGAEPYSLSGNIVGVIDRAILGEHRLYQGFGMPFDPEGLLSTLGAVVNVLLGYWVAGELSKRQAKAGMWWLLAVGALMLVLSQLIALFWPVNKALWTGSYVLQSTGLLLWLLALMVWLVDIRNFAGIAEPLRVYGSNPLFIYILSWCWTVLLSKVLLWQVADTAGTTMSAYQGLYQLLQTGLADKPASLLFALLHVGLFWFISYLLYRRQIFIKI